MRKNLIRTSLFFFLIFSIAHLSLPFFIDIFLALLFLICIRNKMQIFFISITIIISCFIFSSLWGNKRSDEIYFRAHEKFNIPSKKKYMDKINKIIEMPYGDIYFMGKNENIKELDMIRESRSLVFKTDKHGFRNDKNLEEAEIILIGDSFIVGNGTSQEFIPSNVLSKKISKNVANIAYPGGPKEYEKMILNSLDKIRKNAKLYIFYFEGNDFFNMKKKMDRHLEKKKMKKKFTDLFLSNTRLFYQKIENYKSVYISMIYPKNQVFFKLVRMKSGKLNQDFYRNIYKFLKGKGTYSWMDDEKKINYKKEIDILKIDENFMGFYNEYIQVTENNNNQQTHIIKNLKVLERLEGIFFIPTKFRVYSKILEKEINKNHSLNFLKEKYSLHNIPVYDLTFALQIGAKNYIKDNKFMY